MTYYLERNTIIVKYIEIRDPADAYVPALLVRSLLSLSVIILLRCVSIAAVIVILIGIIILSITAALRLRLKSELRLINKYLSHIMLSTVLIIIGT